MQLAKDEEGELVVAGGTPERERKHEGIDLVLLPERQLLILMLRRLVEEVMFHAKWHGPAIVGFCPIPVASLPWRGDAALRCAAWMPPCLPQMAQGSVRIHLR